MDLPEPLTPPECDLRDFPRMMIDITRLFGSTFNAKASRQPLAWMVGHKLWYKSWHQMPAASLPDDDDELCYLAELGFDLKTFRRVKALAMHGWIKCSDGRLYHPVVAEAAIEGWDKRLRKRHATECARIKKHNQRHGTSIEAPSFEAFISGNCTPMSLDRPADGASQSPECPEGHNELSLGTGDNVPREIHSKGKGRERDIIIEQPVGCSRPPDFDHVGPAFAAYEAMRGSIVPNARSLQLTPERRKKLAARLGEIGGPAAWGQVLETVQASAFLRGETSRNGSLIATIDWLLESKNLRKVMEGNYDDGPAKPNSAGNGGRPSAVDSIRAARAMLGAE